jgi:hypothetical protein
MSTSVLNRIGVNWSKYGRKSLFIAPEKSQVTFFSPDSHQANHHPQVFVDGKLIYLNKNACNFGLFWDPQGCYNAQTMHMVKKYNQQHQVLRSVSNNTWGFDKVTLILTNNTVIKPSFSYVVPI